MTFPSVRAPSTHHWQWKTHLVWFKSVGGTNSYDVYMMGGPAAVNLIQQSTGLWRQGYDLSECTCAFHTPLAMENALGLVQIRRGDE